MTSGRFVPWARLRASLLSRLRLTRERDGEVGSGKGVQQPGQPVRYLSTSLPNPRVCAPGVVVRLSTSGSGDGGGEGEGLAVPVLQSTARTPLPLEPYSWVMANSRVVHICLPGRYLP